MIQFVIKYIILAKRQYRFLPLTVFKVRVLSREEEKALRHAILIDKHHFKLCISTLMINEQFLIKILSLVEFLSHHGRFYP